MDFGASFDYQMPEMPSWDQIYGGGEGGGGGFEMPRMQAPEFNWDDPEFGGYTGAGGMDVGGMGGGGMDGMQSASMRQDPITGPNPETQFGGGPGPQTGQPSGSSAQTEDESLWKKFRGGMDKTANALTPETPGTKMLAGLGMAVGPSLLGAGIKGFQSMGGEKKQSAPSQAAPQGQAYQTVTPTPLPGTGASPLLNAGPQKTTISQGMEERMKRGGSTGGFALY